MNEVAYCKPFTLVLLIGILAIASPAIAQPTVLAGADQATSRPKKPAKIPSSSIHKSGTILVLYEGVHLPLPEPNKSGPFVVKHADLDDGMAPPRTAQVGEFALVMNVREASFWIDSPTERQAVEAGPNAVGFARCFELLRQAKERTQLPFRKAPTYYYCVRTTEGRIAQFRVASSKAQSLPNKFVNVSAFVDYTAWNVAE